VGRREDRLREMEKDLHEFSVKVEGKKRGETKKGNGNAVFDKWIKLSIRRVIF